MQTRPTKTADRIDDDRGAGLTRRETHPADAAATLDAGAHAPADLWRALATTDGFQSALADAVRELLADTPHRSPEVALSEVGVTAADGGYARLLAGLDRGPESVPYTFATTVTAAFGQGEVTPLGRLPLEAVTDGPLAALEAAGATPTVAVRVGEDFRERRREQRERALSLLARLGEVCEVAVVATGLTARWLAREHRADLPRSFSEACIPGRDLVSPVGDAVDAARERFDADGRAVRLLRDLAAEPDDTLPYGTFPTMLGVSQSRVSQLLGALEEYDLAERHGPKTEQRVGLLPAGRALLEEIDDEIGRQQRLDAEFSETGQPPDSDVLSRPHTRASQDGPGDDPPGAAADAPYRTRFLSRANQAAAGAAATDGAIVVVEGPVPDAAGPEERHTRFVSYDADREEAVVAVRATTPLQYMVSVALGLASPRLFDRALPADRLEAVDDPPAILRDGRCIGALSAEAADDPAVLRDNIVSWGEDLADMTRRLNHGEYDDRNRFCGEILRSAHGLAGTVIHLLDVAGVDVVRELRVPALGDDDLADLARTVSVATAIQSKYGAFTAYRQLFETRERKRQTALSPAVDAADPVGEYIGSLVVRGPSAERFGQHLEGRLASPAPLHDDAPEFAVAVPVATAGREAYTAAVNRMLATKRIRATPDAVTLFQALAADPYAVTEAIRWLGEEEHTRRVRLEEVRVSLANLPPDRLLPSAPPSVSKAVAALLRSSRPLSQTALAEAADVSTRSLRRHLAALEALDMVRDTGEGYRLALPFPEEERGERILPSAMTDDLAAAQDLVFAVTEAVVDDTRRFGDPSDPVGAAFIHFPPDYRGLRAHLPEITPWVDVAKALCNSPAPPTPTVAFGADLEQTALGDGGARESPGVARGHAGLNRAETRPES